MPEDPPLSADERAELERLRAENAALRARAGPGGAGPGAEPTPAAGPATRRRWRTVVAALLLVLACLLAPLSLVAVWTRNQLTDTDRYVATVTPLAATRPSRTRSPTRSPPRCSPTSTSRG